MVQRSLQEEEAKSTSSAHQILLGSSSLQDSAAFLATSLLIINAHSACWGPMLGLNGKVKEGFN